MVIVCVCVKESFSFSSFRGLMSMFGGHYSLAL